MFDFKCIYEDDTGCLLLHKAGGRLWLHAYFFQGFALSKIKHFKLVFKTLEDELRKKNIKELYTSVSKPKNLKFAEFFGFCLTNEVVYDTISILVKRI